MTAAQNLLLKMANVRTLRIILKRAESDYDDDRIELITKAIQEKEAVVVQ